MAQKTRYSAAPQHRGIRLNIHITRRILCDHIHFFALRNIRVVVLMHP
jgi:hypothetical protein